MVLRHQKAFSVLPFEPPTKDPDTSIHSVAAIGSVQKQQMSGHAGGGFCSRSEDEIASLGSEQPQRVLHEAVERTTFEPTSNSGVSYLPPQLSSNLLPYSHAYNLNNLPRQATLSLRDMYDDEDENFTDSTRGPVGGDDVGDHDVRHDLQQFDMSPASKPLDAERRLTSVDAMRNRRVAQPPTSTVSPAVLCRHQPLSNPVVDSSNEDSPPTPQASSPASSVNSFKAVKQIASYLPNQAPVLYSAIGSLEDPTTAHSFSRRYIERKFDFPSLLGSQPKVSTGTASKRSGSTTTITKKARPKVVSENKRKEGSPAATEHQTKSKKSPQTSQVSGESVKNVENLDTAAATKPKKPSNLRRSKDVSSTSTFDNPAGTKKSVKIAAAPRPSSRGKPRKKNSPPEMFRPSSDAYTPRMGKKVIKYKDPEMRTPVASMASPLGTLQRPNFRDALRRVAMILHQHVAKIEQRFESQIRQDDGLFRASMRDVFSEEQFATPTYRCTMVRVPMARPGMVYGLKRLRQQYTIPSEGEIYDFAHRLFKSVQLSSECSIVCLIYVERLMETAKVPLLADTWRPIFMCGLLLASKVWQDLSSWNIEFASVYPQYSLDSINRLELLFLRNVKWDLYISSSCYAKYYFALRSLVEKQDFRQRYNRMVGGVDSVQASEALKIEKRSYMVKEEALSQLSRSM